MKKAGNVFIKTLPYFCLVGVITLGLMTIVATGGGGGGSKGTQYEAQAIIGPEGGVVEVTDPESPIYGTKVEIPQSALKEDTRITITVVEIPNELPGETLSAGQCIDFGPEDVIFYDPVIISLPYEDEDNDGLVDGTTISENEVVVRRFDELLDEWIGIDVINRDEELNIIQASVNHFSSYQTTVNDDYRDHCDYAQRIYFNSKNVARGDGYLEVGGDTDCFYIEIPESGTLTVSTCHSTVDTYGYMRNSACSIIANNDNASGILSPNFRIQEKVEPGLYYIDVRASNINETGIYRLIVSFIPDGYSLVGRCESYDIHGNLEASFYRNSSSNWFVDYVEKANYPNIIHSVRIAEYETGICSDTIGSDIDAITVILTNFRYTLCGMLSGESDAAEMNIGLKIDYDAGLGLGVLTGCVKCKIERGSEICGDGIDNNWNGEVDEGCDFEGTWYGHELISGDGLQQEPGWSYRTITVDSDGNVTYSGTNHNGQTDSGTMVWPLSINNDGIITNPSNIEDDPFSDDLHGVMSNDKKLTIYTQSEQPKDQPMLTVGVKREIASNFSNADLEGTWRYHGLISGDAPNQTPGWYWGEFTFDQNGSLTNATPITDSLGNSDYTPSDPGFNLSSDGIITISGLSGRGVMNDNKDMIVAVTTMCPGRNTDVCGYNLGVMVKKSGASFSNTDLTGTWYQHHITSGDFPQLLIWCYSSGIMDNAGNFTFTGACSDGDTTKSGTFSITNDGIVTIVGESSSHGVMSSDKKLIVFTFDDGGGGYGLMMLVKRG